MTRSCGACHECHWIQDEHGRWYCPYGGPFAGYTPAKPINEAAYIAGYYGTGERSWAERLERLRRA